MAILFSIKLPGCAFYPRFLVSVYICQLQPCIPTSAMSHGCRSQDNRSIPCLEVPVFL